RQRPRVPCGKPKPDAAGVPAKHGRLTAPEDIAGAPDRLNETRFFGCLEFAAQVPDGHFKYVRVTEEIVSPHPAHDERAGEHLVWVAQEQGEEIVFTHGQRDLPTPPVNGAG